MGEALPDHLRQRAGVDAHGVVVQCHESRLVAVASELAPVEGVSLQGGGVIGAVALFVTTAEDGGAALASPPELAWELRGTFGRFSEAITGASGSVAGWPAGWASRGSLVFVSGRLYEGFELWARSAGAGPVRLYLRWMVVPGGGEGAPSVTLGELV
jgi:hypothetical protein